MATAGYVALGLFFVSIFVSESRDMFSEDLKIKVARYQWVILVLAAVIFALNGILGTPEKKISGSELEKRYEMKLKLMNADIHETFRSTADDGVVTKQEIKKLDRKLKRFQKRKNKLGSDLADDGTLTTGAPLPVLRITEAYLHPGTRGKEIFSFKDNGTIKKMYRKELGVNVEVKPGFDKLSMPMFRLWTILGIIGSLGFVITEDEISGEKVRFAGFLVAVSVALILTLYILVPF